MMNQICWTVLCRYPGVF